MKSKEYKFKLLTPCFCHGAEGENTPEMRVPSIRGKIRKWHTLIFGEEKTINVWGGVKNKNPFASKLITRITPLKEEDKSKKRVLPHSNTKKFERKALSQDNEYKLTILERQREVSADVCKSIDAWFLLGTVGMRGNRAFGSVWPVEKAPENIDDYRTDVQDIGLPEDFQLKISNKVNLNMANCTDTLNIGHIFGYVKGNKRFSSPLKMKYIKLGNNFHIVLHASKTGIIEEALKELKKAGTPLGQMNFKDIL